MARLPSMLTAVLFMSLLAPIAVAQDRSGFSANAELGVSQIKDRDSIDTFSGNALGYNLGIEYRFGAHFALGTNIFWLGTADDDFNTINTEIEVKGFDFVGRVIFPLSNTVEFFALAGQAVYKADVEPGGISSIGGIFGEDAIELGIGLDFGNSENFSFRVVGRHYNGPRDESGGLLTVGIRYRF